MPNAPNAPANSLIYWAIIGFGCVAYIVSSRRKINQINLIYVINERCGCGRGRSVTHIAGFRVCMCPCVSRRWWCDPPIRPPRDCAFLMRTNLDWSDTFTRRANDRCVCAYAHTKRVCEPIHIEWWMSDRLTAKSSVCVCVRSRSQSVLWLKHRKGS